MKTTLSRTLLLLLFILIFGCTTTGSGAQENIKSGPMPVWVNSMPKDDDVYMYLVGSGFSAAGNLVEAEREATDNIISQVMHFINVKITATTSAEGKGSVDEYTTSISKQIVEIGSARVSGLRVREKWYQKNERGVILYILISYEKQAILKEKERLEKLIIITIDSVRIPEEQGDRFVDAGRYFQAVLRYIDAAVAAAESGLEDRDIAFNRTIAKAMACLEKINFVKLNDNLTGYVGEEPAAPFGLKVAAGPAQTAKGIPDATVLVTYYESKGGTGLDAKSVVLQSDTDGIVTFKHPVTSFVGKGTVTMRLDISSFAEKLSRAEKKYPEKVSALQMLALSKSQEFQMNVLSRAKSIPLAVFVVDCDEARKPLANNQSTASGISESLSREGFQLRAVGLDPALVLTRSDSQLADIILKNIAGVERAVIGSAAIESFYQDQGRYIVRVTGTVKVLDLKSRQVIYEKTLMKNVTGVNLESARVTAFKQLGKDLGIKIAVETP